jgi:RNA polymerase sigma factor (sigma-70 family)
MHEGDNSVDVLVAQAIQGEQDAWNEIVDRYTPLVISVILRFRLPRAESEDVAQTVWLRLIEHLHQLRDPRALPKWIMTTATRESLLSLSTARRTQPRDPHDAGWPVDPQDQEEPEADLIRSERQAALLAGLGHLSSRQRQVLLLLSEDPPPPYTEISRRTGIPVGAIGPTRARGLERLRRAPSMLPHLSPVRASSGGRSA